MTLYEEWQLKKRLFEWGLQRNDDTGKELLEKTKTMPEEVQRWISLGLSASRIEKYAGKVPIQRFLSIKKEYEKYEQDQKILRRWFNFFHIDKLEKALEFFKRGWRDVYVVSDLVDVEGLDVDKLERAVQLYTREGITKDEVVKAFLEARIIRKDEPFQEESLVHFHNLAKSHNLMHPNLIALVYNLEQEGRLEQKFLKTLQERIHFYQGLGLSKVKAEEWTYYEMKNNIWLSHEFVLEWIKAGFMPEEAFRWIQKLREWLRERPLTIKEVVEFAKKKTEECDLDVCKRIGIKPEEYIVFRRLGITYERWIKAIKDIGFSAYDFEELLKRTVSQADSFARWIAIEGRSVIDWIELGVDYHKVYELLKDRGISLERLKELLEKVPLDTVVKYAEEGMDYEQIKQEIWKQTAQKEAVKVFKRRR